jgi:hypothetical protein
MFKNLRNNRRPYVIHVNLEHDVEPRDILESYYFSRLLDSSLQKTFAQTPTYFTIEHAIRASEW